MEPPVFYAGSGFRAVQPMAEKTALRVLLIPDHRGNEAVFAQTHRLGSGDNHVVEHDHAQRMQRAKGVEGAANVGLGRTRRSAGMVVAQHDGMASAPAVTSA